MLIIRLSSIGDVTHALPVAQALHESFPHLEITWIVEEMSAEIVIGSPAVHDVITVPRSRWKKGRWHSARVWREYADLLKTIRARRFDVSLDLQGYAKSALFAIAAGARHRYGWWRLRDGAGLVSRAVPRRSASLHRVDWFLDVARALGAEPARVTFPVSIAEHATNRVRKLLTLGGIAPPTRYAVVNPAVGDLTRRWGAERYADVAQGVAARFGLAVVLIGSEKDAKLCAEVAELARTGPGWPANVPGPLSLAGQTDLKELAALLKGAAVHICGDTGSAHIAAALERPVVALYGPTDPAVAGPWGQSANVLSHRELCAARCSVRQCVYTLAGAGGCGETTARCLAEIGSVEVMGRVEAVINE